MDLKRTLSDIYDVNKKTGALILGKNRLDDYATKFLTKYYKEALIEPMPVSVDEILKKMGLKIYQERLSRDLDVFGCCLLLDAKIKTYNDNSNEYIYKNFNKGTIIIDPVVSDLYGEGFRRNTIIHEIVHWEKDKVYFEILNLKNKSVSEKLSPIMCKQSEMFFTPPEGSKTKINEIRWLEWQAHRLAPRILMPKNNFKNKALEILKRTGKNISCDFLVQELSEFFVVSRTSVKYRLLEVNLEKELSNLNDYSIVFSEINSKDYIKLEPYEAIKMINENSSLSKWVDEKKLIFVEGYFVPANKEFVIQKEGKLYLSEKVKRNFKKYIVNIREQNEIYYDNYNRDYLGFSLYRRDKEADKKLITFHLKYQTEFDYDSNEVYDTFIKEITSYNEKEEKELIKILGNPDKTLCNALWFLMENRGWKYPEIFYEKTELHKNYHGKIKNDKYNNMTTRTLMSICVGLKLSLRLTEKLFEKSENKLNYYDEPDKTYIRIMEKMPGLDIRDFNVILDKLDIKELGTEIK